MPLYSTTVGSGKSPRITGLAKVPFPLSVIDLQTKSGLGELIVVYSLYHWNVGQGHASGSFKKVRVSPTAGGTPVNLARRSGLVKISQLTLPEISVIFLKFAPKPLPPAVPVTSLPHEALYFAGAQSISVTIIGAKSATGLT